MDSNTNPIERISFLVRSNSRVRIVEHLLHAGPATQRELRDRLEVTRSTVARSLGDLEERNWIEREGDSYRLTKVGELVVEELLDLVETVRTTEEMSAFATWFPFSEYDIDVEQLWDAEITAHVDGDPYAPARKQTELFRTVSRFRGFLPSIDIEGTKFVHEQITSGELEAEIVVSPSVERRITSDEFAPLFREEIRTGRLTVLAADADLPFYLGLVDDGRVQIGVEDDEGFPRALLESSNESIREWAEDVYRDHRSRARSKPIEEFD